MKIYNQKEKTQILNGLGIKPRNEIRQITFTKSQLQKIKLMQDFKNGIINNL